MEESAKNRRRRHRVFLFDDGGDVFCELSWFGGGERVTGGGVCGD